jgi:hypothetical protein
MFYALARRDRAEDLNREQEGVMAEIQSTVSQVRTSSSMLPM